VQAQACHQRREGLIYVSRVNQFNPSTEGWSSSLAGGESSDIAARLSEHFNGSANSNPDILPMKPTGFIFELVPAVQRVQREYLLIVELKPRANRK